MVRTHGERLYVNEEKTWGAFGIAVFFALCGLVPFFVHIPVEDAPGWTLPAVGGGVIFLCFLGCLFRSGSSFDRSTGVFYTWAGFGPLTFGRRYQIEPTAVRIECEEYQRKGQKFIWHPVKLLAGKREFHLCQPDDVMKAGSVAQTVASFLNVQVIDQSFSHTQRIMGWDRR